MLVLLTLGCAASLGPLEFEFWKGFNVELDFPSRLCIGCLNSERLEAEDDARSRPPPDLR